MVQNEPKVQKKLKDVQSVSEDELEKIIELDPDLIIGASTTKNLDKLKEIAPTVTYTYGKVDYLSQHLEIGKLLNKEKEAQAWIDDYKSRAAAAGKQIKEKSGKMLPLQWWKAMISSLLCLEIIGEGAPRSSIKKWD